MGFVSSEQLDGQSGKRRRQGERNGSREWRTVDSEQNFYTPERFVVDDHASTAQMPTIPPFPLPVHVQLGSDLLQHRKGRVPGAWEPTHHTTDHHVRTFGWTRSMDLKSHCSLPTSVDAAERSEKFETKDRSGSGRCARRSISINRTINHLIRLASHTIPFHLRVMRGIFQGSTVNILISAIHNLAWECGKDNVDEYAISMHRCRT